MGGHSHWSTIKRQKASQDAKRGQLFTKLAREVTVSARDGGGDPDMNPRLRLAIDKARGYNMPMDNIDRAIKRGSGHADASDLVEARFEGYGPGGVAIMVDVLTDNRNRAVQELRTTLTRGGGNLGESRCVAWLFESKGLIGVNAGEANPDEVALSAIDAGADDVRVDSGRVEVYTPPTALGAVRQALSEGWSDGGIGGAVDDTVHDRHVGREDGRADAEAAGLAGGAGRRAAGPLQRRLPGRGVDGVRRSLIVRWARRPTPWLF